MIRGRVHGLMIKKSIVGMFRPRSNRESNSGSDEHKEIGLRAAFPFAMPIVFT